MKFEESVVKSKIKPISKACKFYEDFFKCPVSEKPLLEIENDNTWCLILKLD